jgi:hypothetical protein
VLPAINGRAICSMPLRSLEQPAIQYRRRTLMVPETDQEIAAPALWWDRQGW